MYKIAESESAKGYLFKVLEVLPNCYEVFNELGELEFQEKNFEKALEYFDKAIEGEVAFFKKRNVNEFQDAISDLKAMSYTSKGDALKALERFEEALISYESALELNQYYVDANHGKAEMLCVLGRDEDVALNHFDRAIVDVSDIAAESFSAKACLLFKLKRYDEAIIHCKRSFWSLIQEMRLDGDDIPEAYIQDYDLMFPDGKTWSYDDPWRDNMHHSFFGEEFGH